MTFRYAERKNYDKSIARRRNHFGSAFNRPDRLRRFSVFFDQARQVWDIVAVYEPGKLWDQKRPEPAYSGGPVVEVIDEARTAIRQQLHKTAVQK